MLRRILWLLLLQSCVAMPSCRSDFDDVGPTEATCRTCRAAALQVKRILVPTGTQKRPKYRTMRTSRCSDCRCDVELYEIDGIAHMRCANCAPGGVACP